MSEVKIKDKEVVVPGEILAEGMDFLPGVGTYREGDLIRAKQLGLVNVDGRAIKLISLSGRYLPKAGDVIIGKVIDVNFSGWRIETNCAYSAMLGVKDAVNDFVQRGANLTQYIDFGEYVAVKITNVTSQKLVDVVMKGPGLKKLGDGRIIEVSPNKVPRIIGKAASMVNMLKAATSCKIVVGQNGLIWVSGEAEKEAYVVELIKRIERDSHISGLTDTIKKELEDKFGEIPELPPEEKYEQNEGRREFRRDGPRRDNRDGNFRPPRRKFNNSRPRFRTPVE